MAIIIKHTLWFGITFWLTCLTWRVLAFWSFSNKILAQEIHTITLRADAMTTARRGSPIPQLQCIGGDCNQHINNVKCTNTGFDGQDVQWACTTYLPSPYTFGSYR